MYDEDSIVYARANVNLERIDTKKDNKEIKNEINDKLFVDILIMAGGWARKRNTLSARNKGYIPHPIDKTEVDKELEVLTKCINSVYQVLETHGDKGRDYECK